MLPPPQTLVLFVFFLGCIMVIYLCQMAWPHFVHSSSSIFTG